MMCQLVGDVRRYVIAMAAALTLTASVVSAHEPQQFAPAPTVRYRIIETTEYTPPPVVYYSVPTTRYYSVPVYSAPVYYAVPAAAPVYYVPASAPVVSYRSGLFGLRRNVIRADGAVERYGPFGGYRGTYR